MQKKVPIYSAVSSSTFFFNISYARTFVVQYVRTARSAQQLLVVGMVRARTVVSRYVSIAIIIGTSVGVARA